MKQNGKRIEIVKAGFQIMDKKGYRGTGISDIISEVGIPKGSFYHYFKNKASFTTEVLNYYSEIVLSHLESKLKNEEFPALERIKNLYNYYLQNIIDSPEIIYGGFANKISQEVGEQNLEIRQVANNVYSLIKHAHVECLNIAIKNNELDINTNTDNLAELIIFAWEGALARMRGGFNPSSLYSFIKMLETLILHKKTLNNFTK